MSTIERIALITGGSRGLGRNAALHAAREGVDIILTYHSNAAEAQAAVAEIQALGRRAAALQLDVGDSAAFANFADQVKAVLADWGRSRFDYLVNNAGIGLHAPFTETSEAQFDELVRIHLKAPYFLTQTLLPLINDGGRIINVSSGLARFTFPGMSAYAMMKGGVEVLTRYLAKELGARGISANTIAPGAIATDFGGGAVRDDKQANAFVAGVTALGRAGQPDDIGPVVAALLSPGTKWINGQRIEASGGMML
ncbi:SDR family NAD(P)-dependent oxidoreductase [Bordetella genomosp. 9]|uniref:Short-chain dehydrogenase n=1 Tax=Bordetella genomosp. 9 TaxID=1416803 RepID=A0A1W6YZM4_9BORD|nr:SDR family oxidoreductase [Bordetella genomosp. 9]ARP86394.1 short-chain dehydrogenase [Bordetella genomosp. 9]